MKVQIFVSHPDVNNSVTQQFFKSTLALAEADVEITVLDEELHSSQQFNVADHQEKILAADHVILQFPLYWYLAPYSLKKWQDDVFTNRFINELKKVNQLKSKSLSLVINTGQPQKDFQPGKKSQFSLNEILRPYQVFANELGFDYLTPFIVYQFAYLNEQEQYHLLVDYLIHVELINPSFVDKGQYLLNKVKQTIELDAKIQLQAVVDTLEEQLTDYKDLREALDEVKDNEE
ncbi:NAD(P)H-dependent oxidoreductase [Holzapfeliella floricola]|uniref:NAD(P)H dehydrogenase (Quinone) n=1 Tax=Holzapfeliella floricola DSM 23037 = JCM 16512 TaxID=1423744 RepID=A0A0R2DKX7_9LACO|nr:NAD(P)H-dependent oxidoreductase [Holzapfeliella floricola]KRN04783.1 NAD(P)H dehydrogenase (quinone) [Holzapfeliella floricola DSM 23037 = JCM 16512]